MALQHPAYGNPAVIWQTILGKPAFNPRTTGELRAEVSFRHLFEAQEITFASSQKKIVITAEIEDFGSPQYRCMSLTLDVNIQSGIYLYKRGQPGPVRDMSYTECVEKDGDLVYHLTQADIGTLHLSVIESCYSARLFTFEGTDHLSDPFEVCGEFTVTPPHAAMSY